MRTTDLYRTHLGFTRTGAIATTVCAAACAVIAVCLPIAVVTTVVANAAEERRHREQIARVHARRRAVPPQDDEWSLV